jgi:hypothetical protein
MITVHFSRCHEVRMGSPYRICSLHLRGEWTPDLGERGWQPLYCSSLDGTYLALVEWDIADNMPGFRVVLVDEKRKSVESSPRILGYDSAVERQFIGMNPMRYLSPYFPGESEQSVQSKLHGSNREVTMSHD